MKIEDYPTGYEAILNVISRGDKKTYSTYFSEWNDWTFYRRPTIDSKYKMKNGDENIIQWHKDVLGKFSSTFIIWGKRRYVWSLPDGSLVIVQNGRGSQLEVAKDVSAQQALDSWRAYTDLMIPKAT